MPNKHLTRNLNNQSTRPSFNMLFFLEPGDKNNVSVVTVFVVLKWSFYGFLMSYKHIYLSWSDGPERVVPIMIFLI